MAKAERDRGDAYQFDFNGLAGAGRRWYHRGRRSRLRYLPAGNAAWKQRARCRGTAL